MFQKLITSPYYQSGLCILATVSVLLFTKFLQAVAGLGGGELVYWELAFAFLLAYIMFNSILSLRTNDGMIYYRDSIFSFVVLGAITGELAYLLSGLSLNEAATFKWLSFVFTLVYIIFLTIASLMRKFMEYAKKQGTNLPR